MVLGHTFSFYTQEEADRLVKFFRKEGISARIEPVAETSLSVIIKGKYDTIYSYLVDVKEKLQTEKEDEGENPDESLIEEINRDIEDVEEIITLIQKQRDDAIRGLEGKNPGDIAFENPIEDQDPEKSLPSLFTFMFENKILLDNDVIGFEEKKLVYKNLKPVDELLYAFVVSDRLVPEEEDLETYNISRILKIHAEVDYKVKTGPELIARVNFDQLKEELEEYDIDDEFIAHAVHSIIIKQELVEHILNVLDVTKAGTMEELFEALEMMPTISGEDSRLQSSFDISPEYTIQAVEDLKKMDLIRMKGNKIKMNR